MQSVAAVMCMVTCAGSIHVQNQRPLSGGSDLRLPEVSTMMGGASDTLKSINSQTILFETRVAQKQAENQAKLSKLKAGLEDKLVEQQKANKAIAAVISNLTAKIQASEAYTTTIEKEAWQLKKGNDQRRTDLGLLQQKLATARAFVESSLNATDDSAAEELTVFNTPPPAKKPQGDILAALGSDKSVEEAMEFIAHGGEGTPEGVSLLSLKTTVAGPVPQDLLQLLQQGLDKIEQEEQASEKALQDAFKTAYGGLVKQGQSMEAQKTGLEAKLQSILKLQSSWSAAKTHLMTVRGQLDQRLKGLHLFLERLSGVAK